MFDLICFLLRMMFLIAFALAEKLSYRMFHLSQNNSSGRRFLYYETHYSHYTIVLYKYVSAARNRKNTVQNITKIFIFFIYLRLDIDFINDFGV